ncbi:STK_08120 family protein [Sulfolobus tengchongensis]|uniref:STK_08120 family protein n=1 Tax=Sulfolobus tengchongensis TaxID=207809 RepID=A0AAX4KY65_9CREN
MQDKIEIYGEDYDERLSVIFADPQFLLPNLLGALNVEVNGNDFKAEIPMSILFGRGTFLIHGKIFTSLNSITYVINVAGYGPDKGGKIRIDFNKNVIKIDISLNIPAETLNGRIIKGKVKEFKSNANELIRLERIKRKI